MHILSIFTHSYLKAVPNGCLALPCSINLQWSRRGAVLTSYRYALVSSICCRCVSVPGSLQMFPCPFHSEMSAGMVLTLFNCHQFCFFCTDLHSVSWGCSVHLFDELGWLVLLPFLLSDGRVSLSGVGDASHTGRYSCPCGILLAPRLLCPLPGVSVYSGWSWASPCLHGSN